VAIPTDINKIHSNLSLEQLEEVLKAIDEEQVEWFPEATSVFAESAGGEFGYQGKRYAVNEFLEVITSVQLIS